MIFFKFTPSGSHSKSKTEIANQAKIWKKTNTSKACPIYFIGNTELFLSGVHSAVSHASLSRSLFANSLRHFFGEKAGYKPIILYCAFVELSFVSCKKSFGFNVMILSTL